MLKISEYNTITGEKIDLKELEKYGMLHNPSSECYEDDYSFINLCIYEEDRGIQISIEDSTYRFSKDYENSVERAKNILYDLIKDGYVVKE